MDLFLNRMQTEVFTNIKDFCMRVAKIASSLSTMYISFPQDPKNKSHFTLQIILTSDLSFSKPLILATEVTATSLDGFLGQCLQEMFFKMDKLINLYFYHSWEEESLSGFAKQTPALQLKDQLELQETSHSRDHFRRKSFSFTNNPHNDQISFSKSTHAAGESSQPKMYLINYVLILLRSLPRVQSMHFNLEACSYY